MSMILDVISIDYSMKLSKSNEKWVHELVDLKETFVEPIHFIFS